MRGEIEQWEREIEREQGWRKERADRAEREREWREKSRARKKGAQWERGCRDGERVTERGRDGVQWVQVVGRKRRKSVREERQRE